MFAPRIDAVKRSLINPKILDTKIPKLLVKIALNMLNFAYGDILLPYFNKNLIRIRRFFNNTQGDTMALFGSEKEELKPTSKKIRPTVIRTKKIGQEIYKIAKSNDIRPETLDFSILEVQTMTRLNVKGEGEAEWEERDPDALNELDEQTELLNPDFQMEQIYEVEIYSKEKDDPYKDFNIAIGANATKCHIYLSIKAGSKVEYSQDFERDLYNMINKAKVKAGILINIFDKTIRGVISKIVSTVRVDGRVTYAQNENHLICQGYEPTPTIDDRLILHYENAQELDDLKKVDYSKRGFIRGVVKDELLIEYIKPKKGQPGRNCRGEYLEPKEPLVKYAPKFGISDDIKVIDNEENIQYIAKDNGYISFENNQYLIKTNMDVGEISFKTTGSIDSGVDSEVNLVVKETDAIKDAIGTGMVVEVGEIQVEGNIGSSSKVTALKASIGGQTHKTSEVRADEININVHKGRAYGKDVHITRLEHGEVYGKNVSVRQAVGGKIEAEEVVIDICASYVKVTASRLIEIEKLQGEENVFIIDPLAQVDAQKGVAENEEKIKELKTKIRDIKKEIEKFTALVKNNEKAFNDLKKRLIHYKKNGVKLPTSFVTKYKNFQKMQEHLEEITKEEKSKSHELDLYDKKTGVYQDGIFAAKIINRDRWRGHNELIFKLVEPPMELKYVPKEGSDESIFTVVQDENEDFIIKAEKA